MTVNALSVADAIYQKNGKLVFGTHSGYFHSDEVLAASFLRSIYPTFDLVRSRNEEELKKCDIVFDVGAVYDPMTLRFDHHQRSFESSFSDAFNFTKMSSAGLIYKHFGKAVLSRAFNVSEECMEVVYQRLYEDLFLYIDCNDNGVSATFEKPRYRQSTDLANRVRRINPGWNDAAMDENAQFRIAMDVCGEELNSVTQDILKRWLPAFSHVQKSVENRFNVDSSGRIVLLPVGGMPWNEILCGVEEELGLALYPEDFVPSNQKEREAMDTFDGPKGVRILYCIYPEKGVEAGGAGPHRVQCVKEKESAFTNRRSLSFGGLRGDELSKAAGIEGLIFVHAAGFIGGANTYEGALALAREAFDRSDKPNKIQKN